MTHHEWMIWFWNTYGRMPTWEEKQAWMAGGAGGGGDGNGDAGGDAVGDTGDDTGGDTEGGTDTGMSPELEAVLENFRNALAMFTTQPGFVTGEGGPGGWSGLTANWMQQYEGMLENQFLQQYLQQATADPAGELPEYKPMDWLSTFDPEQARRMYNPAPQPTGWRVPVTTTRRLRI